jgi:hypothetical protein
MDEISPSAALPIIAMLPPVTDPYHVRMVLPPVIPFVERLLNSAILILPVADITTNVLQQVHENSGSNEIREFVEGDHRERASLLTRTETIIWETTHDYKNNMNEIWVKEYPFVAKFAMTFERSHALRTNAITWRY